MLVVKEVKSEHFGKHLEAEPRGLDDGLKMRERRVNINTKVWGLNNWVSGYPIAKMRKGDFGEGDGDQLFS